MTRPRYLLIAIVLILSIASCKKNAGNKAPIVDAGPSQTIYLPDSARVKGTITDDGKIVANLWSQIAGPKQANILNPGADSTVIIFSVPGNYSFQLLSTDNEGAVGVDTVAILVNPNKNKAPIVDAGPSQTITLPDSARVKGTITDDGSVVSNLWSQIAGPRQANILNPGAESTAIIFSVSGNYSFKLQSTDNEGAVGVDTVSIQVNPVELKTLTLQPVNNPWEFNLAAISPLAAPDDRSYVPTYDLPVMFWLKPNNDWYEVRPMIKFDLSSIPPNQTIVSANLYLYSYPGTTQNGTTANTGPQNGFNAKMITSDWSPATVNWNNQPVTSGAVYAMAYDTKEAQLDMNFIVTEALLYMTRNKFNYGFMLQMANNNPNYNSRTFVSSHNPDLSLADKFPKLVVVYKRS
ncbi:hypothetical protein A4H97_25090 [Niastella yeongjuensis]|uniref:Carbohydrate-binding module family 96 domain-containing protein n=1 Tax=Niastella yeongjuensis TaxID=354355 RepID=A0A1V9F2S1_9BACT|nr:DNRLRE domain-containing protein [Niastella yeongjuensis]OQP52601.1 hypothetical protein A4H97_25090 [Niastella yeongjuensis]SEP33845.1 hypothetical protein SAMN05660816_05334 [Niastella yeongjuensis]